jgi:PTH1 family peptidyl-tRNA hydrolase
VGHVLKDFANADAVWLEPLLDAVADTFPYLAKGDAATFMSKVTLALNPPKARSATGDETPLRETPRGTRGTDGV